MPTCSIDGCNRKKYSRGWCQMHYQRWYHHGDVSYEPPTLAERLWSKVDQSGGPDACWPWQGSINTKGYGNINNRHGSNIAHRVAYELSVGPVPDGLVLDHLCRTRACCNPSHLEPVTAQENTARGVATRTHCLRGHEYTEESTGHHADGGRYCKTCVKTVIGPRQVARARERRHAARHAVVEEFLADERRAPAVA